MANDLLKEFDEGRLAQIDAAAGYDVACPYIATSPCADAWYAGRVYEAQRPSVYGPDKVWSGRGFRVRVRDGVGHPKRSAAPVHAYRIDWAHHVFIRACKEA